MMPSYRCTVYRMQKWHVLVEAENAEDAKDKADKEACDLSPDDDYAYDTTANEVRE